MLTRSQRNDIALDYWGSLLFGVVIIVGGTWVSNWSTPSPGTYFLATFCLIHAHGNRIRQTILALAANKEAKP